jgi:heat shock protein HspQ
MTPLHFTVVEQHYMTEFSSYLAENTLSLDYEDQPVNAHLHVLYIDL